MTQWAQVGESVRANRETIAIVSIRHTCSVYLRVSSLFRDIRSSYRVVTYAAPRQIVCYWSALEDSTQKFNSCVSLNVRAEKKFKDQTQDDCLNEYFWKVSKNSKYFKNSEVSKDFKYYKNSKNSDSEIQRPTQDYFLDTFVVSKVSKSF